MSERVAERKKNGTFGGVSCSWTCYRVLGRPVRYQSRVWMLICKMILHRLAHELLVLQESSYTILEPCIVLAWCRIEMSRGEQMRTYLYINLEFKKIGCAFGFRPTIVAKGSIYQLSLKLRRI